MAGVGPIDQYSPEPQPPRETRPSRALWPYGVALLVIVVGVALYLFFSGKEAPPSPAEVPAPAAEPAEPPAEPAAETLELPSLGASDDWLRRIVGELSTHPDLVGWLVTDDLVRRFTAAVDNVARGESPRPHLGFLGPASDFAVVERDGIAYPAPRSYERYTRVAEVVDSVDAAGAAELYRQLKPLLQQGYADLGYPNRDFSGVLARAVRHLLATPLPTGEPELSRGVESYLLRDQRLESLSPAQKHLLRMGPDNAAVILDKLREIAELLDLMGG
jgi:hypothetical protein